MTTKSKKPQSPKTGLVPILDHDVQSRPLSAIQPSPENDKLYSPIDPTNQDFLSLVQSVRARGVLEALVITEDGYIVSGHRRFAAAQAAKLTHVPCRITPIRREADIDGFVRLLREFNRQRNKTFAEKARESIVDIEPKQAHRRLIQARAAASAITVDELELHDFRKRPRITKAKQPFLDAVLAILEERREYWPLSVRQVHYALLNNPPLKHASKPESRYRNDIESYKNLDVLLVRARVAGTIRWTAIGDETRPVTMWNVFRDPQPFIHKELSQLLHGYYRDLMQSQPNHIEVLVEKNTVAGICSSIAENYCIPMTSGRGFCSLPPRYDIYRRYRRSGKEKLVLLIVSDFDPEGEAIAESFARSMRDDFGIENICPVKVALTREQVERFAIPPDMIAKEKSTNRKRFVDRHGENVWELEALQPKQLQVLLDESIRSVIDLDAYNAEVEQEAEDAAKIESMRRTIRQVLSEGNFFDEDFDPDADFED